MTPPAMHLRLLSLMADLMVPSVARLSVGLQLPAGSVTHMLLQLQFAGYVQQDDQTGEWALTDKGRARVRPTPPAVPDRRVGWEAA